MSMPNFLSAKAKKVRLVTAVIIGAVLMLTGLGAVVVLNKSSQDLRQQAAGKENYIKCSTRFGAGGNTQCPKGQYCDGSGKCLPVSTPTPSGMPTRVPTRVPTQVKFTSCGKVGQPACSGTGANDCKVCQLFISGPGQQPQGKWVSASPETCTGLPCGPK